MSYMEEMDYIRLFVLLYREEQGITKLRYDSLSELSCFMFGEFKNLLYRQLVNTQEFYGGWLQLVDDNVRQCVLEEILKDPLSKKIQNVVKTP